MKRIDAYIRPHALDAVREALVAVGVHGLTAIEVRGFGRQKGHAEQYRGREYETAFNAKIKLEVIVETGDVHRVIDAIATAARTGSIGDGKVCVLDVEEVVRIRTGESGMIAI